MNSNWLFSSIKFFYSLTISKVISKITYKFSSKTTTGRVVNKISNRVYIDTKEGKRTSIKVSSGGCQRKGDVVSLSYKDELIFGGIKSAKFLK